MLYPGRLFFFVIRARREHWQQVGSASPTAGNMRRAHDPENRESGESSRLTPRIGCKLPVSRKGDASEEKGESLAPNGQRLPAVENRVSSAFTKWAVVFTVIRYPLKESEFEVQANLYWALKNEGFHVRGEVNEWCQDFGEDHRVFFDLVVFTAIRLPLAIIECKNSETLVRLGKRQTRRYGQFGVPVLACFNSGQIAQTVTAVKELEESLETESES